MKVLSVVGSRQHVMKVEPVARAAGNLSANHLIMDFGVFSTPVGEQNYRDLGLKPDFVIQRSDIFAQHPRRRNRLSANAQKFAKVFGIVKPHLILVYGDVDSSLAASFAASFCGIASFHVEAGLRNYLIHDSEEFNRRVIDKFSDRLFVTSMLAKEKLLGEGFAADKIDIAGNTIIDVLRHHYNSRTSIPSPTNFGTHSSKITQKYYRFESLFDIMYSFRPATELKWPQQKPQ